jgi:hypothetical protein
MSFIFKLLTPEMDKKVDELKALILFYVENAPAVHRYGEIYIELKTQFYIYVHGGTNTIERARNWDIIKTKTYKCLEEEGYKVNVNRTRYEPSVISVTPTNFIPPGSEEERKQRAFRSLDAKVVELFNLNKVRAKRDWKVIPGGNMEHGSLCPMVIGGQCYYWLNREWQKEWIAQKKEEGLEVDLTKSPVGLRLV